MKKLLLFFSLLFIVFSEVCSATNYDEKLGGFKEKIKKSKGDLENVQMQIQQKRRDKDKIEKKEKNVIEKIKSLDNNLSKITEELIKSRKHLLETEGKIKRINEKLESVKIRKVKHLKILKKELCFIYIERLWSISEWNFWAKGLISAKSLSELMKKYEFLKSMTRQRLVNFQEAQKNEQIIDELKKNLTSEKELLEKIKESTKEKKALFLVNKKEKIALLEELRDKKLTYVSEIEDLKKSAQALQGLIDLLEKQANLIEEEKEKGLLMAQRKGHLPWPIEGTVVSLFGKHKHPELGTYVINNGIKIKSSLSEQIKSVANGKVMFADDFQIYGKMIIVDHGGGFYTIYGHLSEFKISVGKRVEEGEIIGGIKTSRPLYFEIRKTGRPEDPLVWLRKEER